MSVRREIIDFPTSNSRTIEEIQLSTETILDSESEDEDVVSTNGNIELTENLEINNNSEEDEEDLITTYENIEEQSDLSDEDNEFGNVLESNYNVRKSNKGLDHIPTENEYIRQIESSTGLHVLEDKNVWNAYKKGPIHLFHLFLHKNFITERILSWTNKKMDEIAKKQISSNEILAVLGLELAMSTCKVNNIKNYFTGKSFGANDDYRKTMSQKRFREIRGNLVVSPAERTDEKTNIPATYIDPLYYGRSIFNHFCKNSASIAVPTGAAAYDENSKRTKARTAAKQYMPNKPTKYALRFYANVFSKYHYCFSIFDNGRGNKSGINISSRYASIHTELRRAHIEFDIKTKSYDPSKTNALYVLMMAHASKKKAMTSIKEVGIKRWYFTDNYYTRHTLGNHLKEFTDEEARLIGTCKTSVMDSDNLETVRVAVTKMSKNDVKRNK